MNKVRSMYKWFTVSCVEGIAKAQTLTPLNTFGLNWNRLWASSAVYVIAAKGGTDAYNFKLNVRHVGEVFRTDTSGKIL